ncbi:MAG: dephospho-CoA kinase [Myxococcota bacterium]
MINKMRIIGLTGGIGSGKSEVAKIFKKLGFTLLDADELARDAVAPHSPALKKIRLAFGDSCFNKDGTLNRKKLAALVFTDPKKRKKLEDILHPQIFKLFEERAKQLHKQGESLIIFDAALLIETRFYKSLDGLIVVLAPVETRVARIAKRNSANPDEILARINSQIDDRARKQAADWIIVNDSSLAELRKKVKSLAAEITGQSPNQRYRKHRAKA